MATIIDALIVTLGLDFKNFKRGSKEAEDTTKKFTEAEKKAAGELEAERKKAAAAAAARNKAMAESIHKVRNEILMLVGAFTAGMGIKNFTQNTINTAANLGYMSDNLQIGTEKLTAWQRVARDAGGTAESMSAQLKESQNAIAMANRGQMAGGVEAFYQYGGKNIQSFKTAEEYLNARIAIVDQIKKSQGVGQARLAASQMGLDDTNFNLYKLGVPEVQRLIKEKQKLSGISREEAREAKEVKNQWDRIGDTYTQVSTKILFALSPSIKKILDLFERFGNWVSEHQNDINQWIDMAVTKFREFTNWADRAAKSVGGWTNVLIALAAIKVLSMVGKLFLLARALLKVGKAFGLISGSGPGAVAALSAAGVAVIGGAALALHSENLNKGEQSQLNALRNKPNNLDAQNSAMRFFMAKGWTQAQAAGIVANLQSESHMDPAAVGDKGAAYGVAQWHQDRQDQFKEIYGFDIRKSTREQQLAYVDWELRHSEKRAGDLLKAARTPKDAGGIVSKHFERPRDKELQANVRGDYAGSVYGRFDLANKGATQAVGPILPLNTVNMVNSAGAGRTRSVSSNTSSTEVSVGKVEIHTQATHVDGIADAITKSLNRLTVASAANTGLQ